MLTGVSNAIVVSGPSQKIRPSAPDAVMTPDPSEPMEPSQSLKIPTSEATRVPPEYVFAPVIVTFWLPLIRTEPVPSIRVEVVALATALAIVSEKLFVTLVALAIACGDSDMPPDVLPVTTKVPANVEGTVPVSVAVPLPALVMAVVGPPRISPVSRIELPIFDSSVSVKPSAMETVLAIDVAAKLSRLFRVLADDRSPGSPTLIVPLPWVLPPLTWIVPPRMVTLPSHCMPLNVVEPVVTAVPVARFQVRAPEISIVPCGICRLMPPDVVTLPLTVS